MTKIKIIGILLMSVFSYQLSAAPFDSCPEDAYLIQGKSPKLYSIDLSTGGYTLLSSDMGTNKKINAIGFNKHDGYIYGISYESEGLIKFGNDYQIEHIPLKHDFHSELSPSFTSYIGDMDPNENIFYFYKGGSNFGLYAVHLDPNHENYLIPIKKSSENLRDTFDFAVHPSAENPNIYAVNKQGVLYQLNKITGDLQTLSNVGIIGNFGAVYFDSDEFLYIVKGTNGKIYRINLKESNPQAEFFSYGPASSTNDGARCPQAPISINTETSNIDFGDAPTSYKTNLSANGARHTIIENMRMGNSVDSEANSYIYPLSDDDNNLNDDDGVSFVSNIEIDKTNLLSINITGTGYINAWIDYNQNGTFDNNEHIIQAKSVTAGDNLISYATPKLAKKGKTWARFRFSSDPSVEPTGSASNGEVEDYEIEVVGPNIQTHYPSQNGWVTLAYEDLWPSKGDLDYNDYVIKYRTTTYEKNSKVVALRIEGETAAIGALNHNGLGVQIPNLPRGKINTESLSLRINGVEQNKNFLESGQTNAVFIVANDLWDYVTIGDGCKFYNTEKNCGGPSQMKFQIDAEITGGVSPASLKDMVFDPFIFATPGFIRAGWNFGSLPDRVLEIHLKNKAPTDKFNKYLFNRIDDASSVKNETYFHDSNGTPWAIEVPSDWAWPYEYNSIKTAYPLFMDYVQSLGTDSKNWHLLLNADANKTFNLK